MQPVRRKLRRHQRRAAVVAHVAVCSTVILGMGALVLDIGAVYMTQSELQVAADAAALAAAAELAASHGDPFQLAVAAADEYARLNRARGQPLSVAAGDIEFGRAVFNAATGKFDFEPGSGHVDAVRVTVHRTAANNEVEVPFLFAPVLGQSGTQLQARAAAVLIPRDISVVIDLSNSMSYDSQLRNWNRTDGGYSNLRDIWCALDGPVPDKPYIPASASNVDETEYQYDTGPTYGHMTQWGDPLDPASYNPSTDPGLWYIRKGYNTSVPAITAKLTAVGYTSAERSALLSGSKDSTTSHWRNRCGVLLGLAQWSSGKSGGAFPGGGDGDDYVEDSEVTWIAKPEYAVSWNWKSYIDAVQSHYSGSFKYRYGLKTFVDFLLQNVPRYHETNVKWATPEQPTRAIKDAVWTMINVIEELQSLDHVALETFDSWGHHELDLTENIRQVSDTLYGRQAGHYDVYTNIGDGLKRAYFELTSERARSAAAKVIVLMSDGVPNRDEGGEYNIAAAREYALRMARQAADAGMRIYTVSVGFESDRPLMQEIAALGHGQEFYAAGNPEEYSEQLELIFRTLGGKRPVALIE